MNSARPFAALAALAVIYAVFAFLRLRVIARRSRRATVVPEPAAAPAVPRGIGGAFTAEWRRALALRGAFILLFIAPLIYGLYYPQPYLSQILLSIPIAVVDNDLSELSRSIVQTLDASGAVSVALQADTLAEVRAWLDRGEAFAVVGIPPGTQRDVLKGISAHLPKSADAGAHAHTYLFIFRSTGTGIVTAINTLSSELAAGGARSDGSLFKASARGTEPGRHPAAAAVQPDRRLCQLYRPGGLRADPAADPADRRRDAERRRAAQLGRGGFARCRPRLAHLTIYMPALLLYFIVLPRVYGFSTLGNPLLLLAGDIVHSRHQLYRPGRGDMVQTTENAVPLFVATSLPQFFLIGLSWPVRPSRPRCWRRATSFRQVPP